MSTPHEAQVKVARAELVKRVLIVVTTFVVSLCLGLLVVLIYQVRHTQLEGTPVGQKLIASSDRILDCTDPKGECYQQSQRRTAKAVGDIGRYIVLASACAADVSAAMPVKERIASITACVADRLAEPADKP